MKSDHHRRRPRRARLAALALAAAAAAVAIPAALAADSMSGLGASFRPAAGADARPDAGAARGDALPGLRVVLLRGGRQAAAIDGRMVHVGDSVNGLRVTRIDAQGVTLSGEDGASERLLVNPSVLKNTRAAAGARGSNGGERP
ncbi:hypothetical protein [Azohydromonas lata]|uniref:MSHA biogenesis protein MshK n=1 Tax=Azohydromonas lata TaxID=45677 RepID=A0ABU5IDG8_9BURK|nr:hypothetical protein [Azohydromonas lata]MDZ5457028.1 hypothetical protein [Azohydromonas lata]